jgi:hypothetical protein
MLYKLNKKFQVPGIRKPPPADVATQAVLEKVANDPSQGHGVGTIGILLSNEGILLPRFVNCPNLDVCYSQYYPLVISFAMCLLSMHQRDLRVAFLAPTTFADQPSCQLVPITSIMPMDMKNLMRKPSIWVASA